MFDEANVLEPVIDAMPLRVAHSEEVIIRAMIKADIVNKVAEVSEISRVKAAQAVDTVIEGLRNALARGQRIELRGFGVFQVKQRKKGIGRNPKTGVEVKIPPGNTIRFKPGKELRNLL
jgi:DNA-binding protein HU-beta